jgi:2-isopropylmalate synthase
MATISIFDTTLRDGEQSPGASMTASEKLRMAHELEALGVDTLEAGFAAASPDEIDAIAAIAHAVRAPTIAALARATEGDVEAAARAVQGARHPRIHVFIATSDIHLERKLGIDRDACVEQAAAAVRHARRYADDVEFSAEDATRTDVDFLCRVVAAAVSEGATTINLPDTVGYAMPTEIRAMFEHVRRQVPGIEGCVLSTHCHDDLGHAVANSIAAVECGATQVECTLNGIGERAGNAALEEIVMALRVRSDVLGHDTAIRSEHLHRASRMLSHLTGIHPQPNKAIVGRNAFAHEAGIHQHGMLNDPRTYEVMTPEMVGVPASTLVVGKHSGRHGLEARLSSLGYQLTPDELAEVAKGIQSLADRKKEILDEDILSVLHHRVLDDVPDHWRLIDLDVGCGGAASVAEISAAGPDGIPRLAEGHGDGPIAAAFSAADSLHDFGFVLESLEIHAATPGRDATGETSVVARVDGQTFTGRGASTDVVLASVQAYFHVLNKAEEARVLEARHLESLTSWGV